MSPPAKHNHYLFKKLSTINSIKQTTSIKNNFHKFAIISAITMLIKYRIKIPTKIQLITFGIFPIIRNNKFLPVFVTKRRIHDNSNNSFTTVTFSTFLILF